VALARNNNAAIRNTDDGIDEEHPNHERNYRTGYSSISDVTPNTREGDTLRPMFE